MIVNLSANQRKVFIRLCIVVVMAMILGNLQTNLMRVSAQVIPITVDMGSLDYGTVFPGENLEKSFTVSYNDDAALVNYKIIQLIKPLPNATLPIGYSDTRQYCQANPTDYTRCYHSLCPYIQKISQEGEGDTEAGASVSPSDQTDKWYVQLAVPAIIGQVSQDHTGGLVNATGDYGCDISIDVNEAISTGDDNGGSSGTSGGNGSDSGDTSGNSNFILTATGGGGGGGMLYPTQNADTDSSTSGSNNRRLHHTHNPNANNSSSPIVAGAEAAPDLVVSKKVDAEFANPGQKEILYHITITNNGNLTAYGVKLQDVLPDGFVYSGTKDNKRSWDIGNLAPSEVQVINYSVDILSTAIPGSYKNTASVIADNNPTVTADVNLEVKSPTVLGAELSATGFSNSEFILLGVVLFLLLSAAFFIKRKYLLNK